MGFGNAISHMGRTTVVWQHEFQGKPPIERAGTICTSPPVTLFDITVKGYELTLQRRGATPLQKERVAAAGSPASRFTTRSSATARTRPRPRPSSHEGVWPWAIPSGRHDHPRPRRRGAPLLMNGIVLDVSVTMTWCYPDEHSEYAYRVLNELEDRNVVVPGLWALEVANALLAGERRLRLSSADIARFFELVKGLSVTVDAQTSQRALTCTLPLARTFGLSAYECGVPGRKVANGCPQCRRRNLVSEANSSLDSRGCNRTDS